MPKLREAAMGSRRMGLGFMGLADLLMSMGVPYDSDEGRQVAQNVMLTIRRVAIRTSIELAKERGPFGYFDQSKWKNDEAWVRRNVPADMADYVVDQVQKKGHGIRNAALTTVAPTGTLSTVCGLEGYGCEPAFALSYQRHVVGMEEPLIYVSKQFEIAANKAGRPDLIEKIRQSGTLDGIEDCPEEMRRVFATSGDISVDGHVKMQAAIQNNGVDSAVSKTINLPNSATIEDVLKCYTDAHAMGLKGITVYRTGSRQHVVIETKETAESKDSAPDSAGSCPICEKDTLIKESGCSRCTSCDYAVCG